MLATAVLLVLSLQTVNVRVGTSTDTLPKTPKGGANRTKAELDSIVDVIERRARSRERNREGRPVRRAPVTPELERTAFLDTAAKSLLMRARAARLKQDTTLTFYDATAYQRVSAGMGFRAFGRERLLFRHENATHVRWSRKSGVWVDLKGKRTVLPSFADDDADADVDGISPIPYYPGREALWIGSGTVRAEVDERDLVHPIALGSEAYYRYATGDSIRFTLPGGREIALRELRIEPRRPEWRLSVGSFWFDTESAQLVRAAYRFAVPMDIWAEADEETKRERSWDTTGGRNPDDDGPPKWLKGLMSPLQANLEGVTIEYGLYGGRFWLPRAQYAEGWARAGFMRIPLKIEESFKYADVNGIDTLPPVPPTASSLVDSLFGDSVSWRTLSPEEKRARAMRYASADSARRVSRTSRRAEQCKTGDSWVNYERRGDGAFAVAVRVPCDTTVLVTSPDLPRSIYDEGDAVFSEEDRAELMKALDFSLQPGWSPQPPVFTYGLALTRYNRVEGLSTALGATQHMGRGWSVDGLARIGTGTFVPDAEFGVSRSNGRTTWRGNAYRRLALSTDWGAPLSFGSGMGALLYGRDEGYYYRTMGVEVERVAVRGTGSSLRIFAELQRTADTTTRFNLARALGGGAEFLPNFEAEKGSAAGAALRQVRTLGLDPNGWRLFSDVRLEGGWFKGADSAGRGFGRVAGDVTISHGLPGGTAAALTLGAGTSERAPLQRHFFIGGTHTVRGQLAGAMVGDSYWLARLELAGSSGVIRPVVFGDIGWAGKREDWSRPSRPLSGVGIGGSILDGLIRVDLARGIYPRERFKFDVYLEAKF